MEIIKNGDDRFIPNKISVNKFKKIMNDKNLSEKEKESIKESFFDTFIKKDNLSDKEIEELVKIFKKIDYIKDDIEPKCSCAGYEGYCADLVQ